MIEREPATPHGILRDATPVVTLIAATLLDLLWLPIPGFNAISPAFPWAVVFCWTAWRPGLLPFVAVFVVGVFEDLVRGTPLGAGSLAMLVVQAFVRAQPRQINRRSFEELWLGFAMAGSIAAIANWLALSFSFRQLLSPWPGVVQYLVTLAVFPVVAWLLVRVDRGLAPQA